MRDAVRRFCHEFLPRLIFVVMLVLSSGMTVPAPGRGNEWKQAIGPRTWTFPKDHGAHPEYRTEWWYFTGNLVDDAGARYGYQLTFFRQGIQFTASNSDNPWSIRDLYIAHFAITAVTADQFWATERMSRAGPGLAGAQTDGMDVWILDWFAKMEDNTIFLQARDAGMELRLELAPRKPLVFHGENGLSKKGPREGQASYYFSFTDLETRGCLRTPARGPALNVKGTSWFDHEFGSNQLAQDQAGWDWFSLHLSDQRDLMIYLLRRKDDAVELASSGTLVETTGSQRHLRLSDIIIAVLDRWRSPQTGGIYPNSWRIRVPSAQIDLVLSPLVADQELVTEGSTGVIYWEGAVAGRGSSMGREVTCEGYVELTGYAGNLGGLF